MFKLRKVFTVEADVNMVTSEDCMKVEGETEVPVLYTRCWNSPGQTEANMKNVSQAKVRTARLHNSTSSASFEHSDADLVRTWSAFINTLQYIQCLLFFCHIRNASFYCKMNGLLPFTWDNSPCALVTRNVDIVTAGVGPSTFITSQAVKPMGGGGGGYSH
jgi:hypothetical protein